MEPGDIRKATEAAVEWLTGSGIQNRDRDSASYGGFHAYFITGQDRYAYIYSEITGYAMTCLAHLAQGGPKDMYAGAAMDAANWLRWLARDPAGGAYRCRYEYGDGKFRPDRVCTFDNAMCLNGFMAWYHLLGDEFLLDEAGRIADFVLAMQNDDGSFNVRLIGPSRKVENTFVTWSTQPGSFLAKGAMGLLNLHRVNGEPRLEQAARKACDFALTCQATEGRFFTHLVERYTLGHPHCYTIEALLTAGSYLSEPKYLEAAFRAIDWSLSVQLGDGGFPSTVRPDPEPDNEHQRMDIQAQIVRAALWARKWGYEPDMAAVDRGVARLLSMQSDDDDRRAKGALLYGWDDNGRSLPHPNSWVTMFAIQALKLYHDYLTDQALDDIFLLV